VGTVTHFFSGASAAAIKIEKGTLAVGDKIHIQGHTTDFKQTIKSLQINRIPIEQGRAGEQVGILSKKRVRQDDKVYKL